MPTQIQIRRDTAANWSAENPTLAEGEFGYELDSGLLKVGDGTSAWTDLDYLTTGGGGGMSIGGSIISSTPATVLFVDDDNKLKGDTSFSWNESDGTLEVTGSARMGDPAYANWFSSPVNYFTVGVTDRIVPTGDQSFTGAEFGFPVDVTNVGGALQGQLISLDIEGTYSGGTIRGQYIDLFSNSTFVTAPGTGDYIGQDINVDVGAAFSSAIGVRVFASSGGAGATGLVNLKGLEIWNNLAHNGDTTNGIGIESIFQTSVGSAAVVDFAAAFKNRTLLRSGITVTDLRGLSIDDWQTTGGTAATSYGIYLGASIDDLATGDSYAIYSNSLSDSVFAGPVRGPINAYDATAWNGSTKFATEDAVRDKIESLAGGGIPLNWSGTTGIWYHTSHLTDQFVMSLSPTAGTGGSFRVGSTAASSVEQFLSLTTISAIPGAKVAARRVQIGDTEAFVNNTYLDINDTSKGFTFRVGSAPGWIEFSDISEFYFDEVLFDCPNGLLVDGNVEVDPEAYGIGWDGSNEVPTKGDLYDKIETLGGGGGGTPGGSDTQLQYNNASAFGGISGATSDGTNVTFGSGNFRATRPQVTTSIDDANGNEVVKITATASAVNEITVSNAATGDAPTITATGDDTDIDININPKGAGTVNIGGSGTSIVSFTEGTPAGAAASKAVLAADSTAHRLQVSNNNGSFQSIVTDSSTDTLTNKTLTAPAITNPVVTMSAAPGTDDTYAGDVISGLDNSGGVTQWDAVYLNGSSQWVLADANGTNTYPARGLAVATVATANATSVLIRGTVRNDAWAWTPGGTIYLSTTAGGLTQTAPSTSGDKVQIVGFALSADVASFDFNPMYLTVA